jgi:hypothetical protein
MARKIGMDEEYFLRYADVGGWGCAKLVAADHGCPVKFSAPRQAAAVGIALYRRSVSGSDRCGIDNDRMG